MLSIVLPFGLVVAEGLRGEILRDQSAAWQRVTALSQVIAAHLEEAPNTITPRPKVTLPPGALWLLIGEGGQILSSYPPSLRVTTSASILAQAQNHSHLQARTRDFDGVERIYTASEVAGRSWKVIVGVPAMQAWAPTRTHALRHSFLLIIISAFAFILAVRFSCRIEEPIRALEAASRRLAAGNWSEEIAVNGPLELSKVAQQFNDMQQSLREAKAQAQLDEEELLQSREQLRSLAARLEKVIEEERTRIAREIHDDLGQALTSLKMDVVALRSYARASELDESSLGVCETRLTAMSNLIDESVRSVRRLSTDLRPAVLDLGLEAAAEWLLGDFQSRTGIQCELKSQLGETELPAAQSTAMFRILQEALTNVARHAEATTVTVRLNLISGMITMQVCDDGRGITKGDLANMNSLGLVGMRERALLLGGGVTWQGAPGQGTKVSVALAMSPEQSPSNAYKREDANT